MTKMSTDAARAFITLSISEYYPENKGFLVDLGGGAQLSVIVYPFPGILGEYIPAWETAYMPATAQSSNDWDIRQWTVGEAEDLHAAGVLHLAALNTF